VGARPECNAGPAGVQRPETSLVPFCTPHPAHGAPAMTFRAMALANTIVLALVGLFALAACS
jgi:hypothetical protein